MTAGVQAPPPVITPGPADSKTPVGRRAGVRVLVAYACAILVVAAAIVGSRFALRPHARAATPAVSVGHPAAKFPASPQIEAGWGIRFTNGILVADNGGIELRYQVLDQSKAERIHLGDPTSNQLPSLRVDGTKIKVTPSSVLMHFHHGDAVAGQSYSIVYGNAGGVIHLGAYVTVIMKDSLQLKHAQVSD